MVIDPSVSTSPQIAVGTDVANQVVTPGNGDIVDLASPGDARIATPGRPRVDTSEVVSTGQVAPAGTATAVAAEPAKRAVSQNIGDIVSKARASLGSFYDMFSPSSMSAATKQPVQEAGSGNAEDVRKEVAGLAGEQVDPDRQRAMEADRQLIAAQDAALPNASTRHSVFQPDQIAREAEMGGLVGNIREQSEETKRDVALAEQKAASAGHAVSHSITDSMSPKTRIKPSIFSRLSGRSERVPGMLQTDNAPTHRPTEQIREIRKMISNRFKGVGVGVGIYGKIVPLPTLGFREVGVGMQEIEAVIEQNPDMLDNLLRASISSSKLTEINFTSTRMMLLDSVMDLINENNVFVFTSKAPNNRGQDIQRRRLKVLESEQRGVYLHPIMAAMYTADFDGDDMLVSLDPSLKRNAKDPMAHMIGIDGEQSLDMSFLPVSNFADGWEDGKTARDYVVEVIFSRWYRRNMSDGTKALFDKLIDRVMDLSETSTMDSDSQAAAYGKVFDAARLFADSLVGGRERASDTVMGQVTEAVYQGMQNMKVNNALANIGEIVPRESMPQALTPSDSAIYDVIDGMVLGAVPNNFQELKVMMNGFMGNVSGKSAPFRFTADVGKMIKLDSRMRIGDEFVVDPENETDMTDFLQATVKFAYSKRMATDVKNAGKSMYFTEELRRRVVSEVGFPNDVDRDGNPRYRNFGAFLWAFAQSYNRHASIINEANLVWLSNMAISKSSNRKTVATIRNVHNGKLKYKDLASPFIDVYGTYGFDRLFGNYIDYKDVDPYSQEGGGTNRIPRDWYRTRNGRRWVLSRYKLMSIRAFSVGNHISLGDDVKLTDRQLALETNDADAIDSLVAAIADKRTSTASKFNLDIPGGYTSEDGVRSQLRDTTSDGRKTLVGMMIDPLVDIRESDLEGTLLAPGYYAGIGSRETPKDVQDAMTDLAKRLADKGWCARSGHAEGADQAFERGAGSNADIYLASGTSVGKGSVSGTLKKFDDMSPEERDDADRSVERYHPNPKALGKRGRSLISRDYFQVVGTEGNPDSAFIACWTPIEPVYDKNGKEKHGGTNQAIRIAKDRGIPVFNAAEYDDLEQWKNDVIEFALKVQAGQAYRATTKDQMLHVDDAVMTLNATGYEMFRELGMDSTAGFLASTYGKKMIQYADNVDMLASIRAAMVFAWQMSDVTRIIDRLHDMEIDPDAQTANYMELVNRAQFAIDELSSRSFVWNGLVSEMRAEPSQSAFKQLQSSEGRQGVSYWMAPDFWNNEELRKSYGDPQSIRDVIENLDMPWPLKCDIITDIVRWQTQDYHVSNYEVAFQMEVGGDSRFSLNRGAPKASMQVYHDTQSASGRYADKSLRNLRNEVQYAALHHRQNQGELTATIHRLATSPWESVYVDDGVYADVVLAVRDKVYAQTEKAQKHPATSYAYSALSLQRNGGFFDDVYRYDDRMLGLQHMSQISAMDLLKMLDDPNYIITVYDDYGSIGFLNQQALLDIDHPATEQEIWDWLIANPRLACMLRANSACVISDTKGKGYLGSRMSLEATISEYGKGGHDTLGNVKYLMRDHPVYAGLISLLTPAHGSVTRNERSRVPKIEDAVCRELYRAASEGSNAYRVLTNLGVTRQKLRSLLTSDYDKYLASMGLMWDRESIGEARNEANDIYETLKKHVQGYIDEIRRNVPLGADLSATSEGSMPDFMGIDIESVASFWDAVQELSGAKVGVSTGIEGSETYRLSYWVSHMGAKDGYADLDSISELIEGVDDPLSFDGMWTSKGVPLEVRVDESGNVTTNVDEILAMREYDGEEIVTRVPASFTVPDRSTDSHGYQVPSLYVSMVSKRSNGAEKFNLKAMKAGLDGKDSVTKMKGGKYLLQEDGSQVFFWEVRTRLCNMAAERGIDEARMELAKMMMAQDHEMGYEDLSLPNYMSIAEFMLVGSEEEGYTLRSLEQLVAGVKGRIGCRVDDMSDADVFKRVGEIVHDMSDQGIGLSQVWDPQELLSNMRPNRNAGNAQSSIRVTSSVFRRNYDLLKSIMEKTNVEPLDATDRYELHSFILGKSRDTGIAGVKDVWSRSNIVRDYQVIGYIGALDGSSMDSFQNIGPSTAFVIGDGKVTDRAIKDVCKNAWDHGTTVIVSSSKVSRIPTKYARDMIPINDKGDMLIPMFDMRLNGSESRPTIPQFGIFQVPFSRYVISVEDPLNVFELGDAQYKFTRALVSRMHQHDGGEKVLSAMDLFPNVYGNEAYKNANMSVSLASRDVVEQFILNPENPECTIDYGLVEGAKGFEQRVHDVNYAIRRYKRQIYLASSNDSVMRGVNNIVPGNIVAWADMKIVVGSTEQHVLAPIIPFKLNEPKKVPESFKVVDIGPVNGDGSLFSINWTSDTDFFEGGYVKYFDSSGGANKGIINLSSIIEDPMRLKNGMEIDAYCAAASTDSRKIGTDRRIKTMTSLMAIARMEGYNFARADGAFPNNPEMREALLNGRIPMEIWREYYSSYYPGFNESGIVFTNDKKLNAFIDYECRKIFENGGNPSDFLATSFGEDDVNAHVMWEFECMFDNSLSYEDSLLRFLHYMNPGLCPNGIDDDTQETSFRLYRDGNGVLGTDYDKGMLQMQVPYPMSDGRISYVWSNVFVGMSFFGEEWSGNSRPNVNGSSDMLDGENTAAYYGVEHRKDKASDRAAWATSGEGRPSMDSGSFGIAK